MSHDVILQKTVVRKKKPIRSFVKKTPMVMSTVKKPQLIQGVARKNGKEYLTTYELEEIKRYKNVWYLGGMIKKINGCDTNPNNCGYDNTEGFYKIIINDHLAFRYQILAILGKGFSGHVVKCKDHKTMELVAIKIIRNNYRIPQMAKNELDILEALQKYDRSNTVNIVHMKDKFYFRNHLCIAFELYEMDLKKLLKTDMRKINETQLRNYAIDVLKCLQLLKLRKIIHGDIKPENILIQRKALGRHAAVTDFGGSYFKKDGYENKPLIHTLNYASPEILLGEKCGPPTDMWSLGCTLAELHLGNTLFKGHDNESQFVSIIQVLGVPPKERLLISPYRYKYFDASGVPLRMSDTWFTVDQVLKSRNPSFIDFIKSCLDSDVDVRKCLSAVTSIKVSRTEELPSSLQDADAKMKALTRSIILSAFLQICSLNPISYWTLLPNVLVVEVNGSLGTQPLSCLGSPEDGLRRDIKSQDIFWKNNGVEEEQRGNTYLVQLEESLGGGNYSCHRKDGSLINYTVVLIQEDETMRKKIVVKTDEDDYLKCSARNYNGEFHCSWTWDRNRKSKVAFIEARRDSHCSLDATDGHWTCSSDQSSFSCVVDYSGNSISCVDEQHCPYAEESQQIYVNVYVRTEHFLVENYSKQFYLSDIGETF
ncbi:dual specificity tyrosine-phosphorylation-regulated kinase 4-like [Solea senegalensis]|uniref:Dual specificity tyrosine-phosphorylation-regulated kinase 4-like n=1 Tax=Solea senegalensis TaxID=28829 RepID=A0AAV6SPE9_SOLSE|nr:dual specificity tyrosine-phosphorylation-regulated kinase 4-like [Solea senegalensis]